MGDDNIQDIYPLSPMQQGMVFHTLSAPGSGVYCVQLTCVLVGMLDVSLFEAAWAQVVAQHTMLRTAFFWEEAEEALQVVLREVAFGVQVDDWRGVAGREQRVRLRRYLAADRAQGFDLEVAPLMRVYLARLRDDAYQFVWSFHHLILDGWSVPLVLQEVLQGYEGLRSGQEVRWIPAPPYRFFVGWLLKQDRARAEAAWREALRGFDTPTALRVVRATTEEAGYAERRIRVSAEGTAALQALAQQQHLTLNTLVQGAWALVLSRYSGEQDVVFGMTVAGRPAELAGVDRMVGLFINTLPMRVMVPLQGALLPWLQGIQRQQVALRDYDYTPLVQVQGWSEVPRGQMLFESLLVFENQPVASLLRRRGGALAVRALRLYEQTNYPLTLIVVPGAELTIRASYARGVFDGAMVGRLLGHVRSVLLSFVRDPAQSLAQVTMVTGGERQQLLEGWNQPVGPFPAVCVHDQVRAQVERCPDSVAARCGGAVLTYRALFERASWVAQALGDVGPEGLVGVLVDRSLVLPVAVLGVLLAGGAYVPLDAAYPAERLGVMFEDARVSVVVTMPEVVAMVPLPPQVRVVDVTRIGAPGVARHLPIVESDQLAYVLYTSGSTGRPKGVAVSHRNVAGLLHWVRQVFVPADVAGCLAATSLCFDLSVFEVFAPLTMGGALVLATSALEVPRLLEAGWVTLLNTVPSAVAELLGVGGLPDSVHTVALAGEALPESIVQELYALPQVDAVFNLYGPTETTVYATAARLPRVRAPMTIGRPVANTQVFLLDAVMQPVPVGVVGEVYVGGAGVARGYLYRPDLTAERFVPNPFAAHQVKVNAGEGCDGSIQMRSSLRLYKTGDLARYASDGALVFVGRVDEQVKVRGFRVELGEVSAALLRHPQVQAAVVVLRGGAQLVGYVVLGAGAVVQASVLRRFIGRVLPSYMVPSSLVVLEALPLLPNGKVDRRALPAPVAQGGAMRAMVGPRTATEAALVLVWQQVLRVEQVGIYDNFFELGGDSIVSIQVIARARQVGIALSPRLLFQFPTIAELSEFADAVEVVPTEQGVVTGRAVLTPIQRWFFAQQLPNPHYWNQAVILETPVSLQVAALRVALRALVVHHDALRLRFPGGGEQVIVPPDAAVGVCVIDVSGVAYQAQAVTTVSAMFQRCLDLVEGPLVRAVFLSMGAGQAGRLVLIVHHLAVDGVSWRVLLEDVYTAYRQARQGLPVVLPPKTSSFLQWARWVTAYADAPALAAEVPMWSAVGAMRLPWDRAQGPNTEGSRATVGVMLQPRETDALLRALPIAYHSRIDDVLITALVLALMPWVGGDVVRFDMESHGREADGLDLSRTVGWFTALYPVSVRVEDAAVPVRALQQVKEQLRRIPRHGFGYGVLRYVHAAYGAVLQRLPLAEVSFTYLGRFDQVVAGAEEFCAGAESPGPVRDPAAPRPYVLDVVGHVMDDRLQVDWVYSTNVHAEATIAQVAQRFVAVLRSLIAQAQVYEPGRYTSADFPLVRVSQGQLDRVAMRYGVIEDVFPLSAMQRGMLFHSLYEPGSYVVQLWVTLQGALDVGCFERSWRETLGRHAILRGACVWDGLEEPLLLVQQAEVGVEVLDWRMLDDVPGRLAAYAQEDQRRGFDLMRAPLLRMVLIRTGEACFSFVWSFHHVLLDGWSVSLLFREVFARYRGLCRGVPLVVGPVRPYREYVAWLQQQDLAAAEVFWRRLLAGLTMPAQFRGRLGGDDGGRGAHVGGRSDTAGVSVRYREQCVALTTAATEALQQFARQQQLTLNTVMVGAWALLLGRYGGEQDVVFGMTTAGRPPQLAGVDEMVGLFINTLPVRVQVQPTADVLVWLGALQGLLAEVRQYEYTPLVQIQRWSAVARGRALFESIVVFENYPIGATLQEEGEGLAVVDVRMQEYTGYPLTLIVEPGAELRLRLLVEQGYCDAQVADGMLRHLAVVLGGLVDDMRCVLADVPLLSAAECAQMLVDWNATAAPYPHEAGVHTLVLDQARARPDAVALVFQAQGDAFSEVLHVSYAVMAQRAGDVARVLRGMGVGVDGCVGVCLERSPDLVVALLGVLWAGGAYVPLDAELPIARRAFVLEEARAAVVLTSAALRPCVDEVAGRRAVLVLDGGHLQDVLAKDVPIQGVVSADQLAYVVFTSGSTGEPKGVAVSHRAVVRLVQGTKYVDFGADEVFLLFAPITFDAATFEVWGALTHGGRLVIAPPQQVALDSLGRLLGRERVTTLWLTAGLFHQMVDHEVEALCGVRQVLAGGDVLSPGRVNRLRRASSGRVINGYGPTENTTFSTWYAVDSPIAEEEQVPIGRPIAHSQVFVLDGQMQPVPIGVVGELYVGGVGLARGYVQRPDLTAERFVPNPFGGARAQRGAEREGHTAVGATFLSGGPDASLRLYRTGDMVRWQADGVLAFLGRVDQQVKVRGFRVELGEVMAALLQQAYVQDAVVVAQAAPDAAVRLIAYVVPKGSAPFDDAALVAVVRKDLGVRLPMALVPAVFVVLAALPLTPNGKVDYRALPPPSSDRPALLVEYRPPRTPLERTLATLWQAALGVGQVGMDDNFFEVGGDSLVAVRLHSEVQEHVGRDIPLTVLFQYPTIAQLAQYLSFESDGAEGSFAAEQSRAQRQRMAHRRQQVTRKVDDE